MKRLNLYLCVLLCMAFAGLTLPLPAAAEDAPSKAAACHCQDGEKCTCGESCKCGQAKDAACTCKDCEADCKCHGKEGCKCAQGEAGCGCGCKKE